MYQKLLWSIIVAHHNDYGRLHFFRICHMERKIRYRLDQYKLKLKTKNTFTKFSQKYIKIKGFGLLHTQQEHRSFTLYVDRFWEIFEFMRFFLLGLKYLDNFAFMFFSLCVRVRISIFFLYIFNLVV